MTAPAPESHARAEARPRSKNGGSGALLSVIIHPVSGGRHAAKLDGRLLCTSATPFCEAARVLLAEGVDPDARIEMRHAGRDTVILSGTVRAAARLTVSNDRFEKWHPDGGAS
jgi:hypothetical protein